MAMTGFTSERMALWMFEHVEARRAVGVAVAAARLVVLVAARAEGLVAGAGEHHHAHLGMVAAVGQGVEDFGVGQGRKAL